MSQPFVLLSNTFPLECVPLSLALYTTRSRQKTCGVVLRSDCDSVEPWILLHYARGHVLEPYPHGFDSESQPPLSVFPQRGLTGVGKGLAATRRNSPRLASLRLCEGPKMVVIKPNREFTTILDSSLRSEWRRSYRRSRRNTYPSLTFTHTTGCTEGGSGTSPKSSGTGSRTFARPNATATRKRTWRRYRQGWRAQKC